MVSLSVAMIVKNEDEVLERCLKCVEQIADEIIIVDTGSSDSTKEIAKKFTDKVYDFEWCDDFSKARNFSFSKATKDYCMWMDADDVILDENILKINKLKETIDTNVSIVMMKYNTAFDEDGNPTFSYYRERFVKRGEPHLWEGEIHEVIPLVGRLLYQDIAINHRKMKATDANRNLNIFETMIKNGKQLGPREEFYYARELYYHAMYKEAIATFDHFLKEDKGWIENTIDACEMMGYCYSLSGEEDKALACYFKSFQYDVPRGELCCDIGKHFFVLKQFVQSKYWYEQALHVPKNDTSGAFIREECYGFLPAIQLCVCHYQLDEMELAQLYNELAGTYKPKSKEVEYNREFFAKENTPF